MSFTSDVELRLEDFSISGHAQPIELRLYRPLVETGALPIIVYFHGGCFTSGSIDEAALSAELLARHAQALVISVGYSLAPEFPFPVALEDGYLALQWATDNALAQGLDSLRIGIAGHDAGGNLATGVVAIARDRGEIKISALALLAPLLDPSMTRMDKYSNQDMAQYASSYRAYLPNVAKRLHPYAAPLESRRLLGLPPTMIISTQCDCLHIEAEKYAGALISAGVATEFIQYQDVSHDAIAFYPDALGDVADFFKKRLRAASDSHSAR